MTKIQLVAQWFIIIEIVIFFLFILSLIGKAIAFLIKYALLCLCLYLAYLFYQ